MSLIIGRCNVSLASPAAGDWEKDPGIAASEIAAQPAVNLDDPNPHRYWESASAAIANTHLLKDLGETYKVQLLNLERINVSERGHIQTILDDRWAKRFYLDLSGETLDSTADITVADSYTFETWLRFATPPTPLKQIAFLGTGNLAATRDWDLLMDSAGRVLWIQDRHDSANETALDPSVVLTDMQWHHIAITFDDTSNLMSLYVDFVLVDTATDATAVPVQSTDHLGLNPSGENLQIADARLWNRALTLVELTAVQVAILRGAELDLELAWQFEEGTGTAIADTAGNHAGTATGAPVWRTWSNPFARYDSGVQQRWHRPKTRPYFSATDENTTIRTTASLDNATSMSFEFWMRLPHWLDDQTTTTYGLASFGHAATGDDREFQLKHDGGDLQLQFSRYAISGAVTHVLADLGDGSWHHYLITLDGIADEGKVYVDGVQDGITESINSFASNTVERFVIGGTLIANRRSIADFAGDMVIYHRVITPADSAFFDRIAPEADISIANHWSVDEGSGTTIANRGFEATGDLIIETGGAWRDDGDAPKDPDGVFVPGYEDDIRRPPTFVERLTTAVDARHVAIEIFDPTNAAGAIQIGLVGLWEPVVLSTLRSRTGASTDARLPDLKWGQSSIPEISLGTTARLIRATLAWLSLKDAMDVRHTIRRAMELEEAIILNLNFEDEDRAYWPLRTVYGVPERLGNVSERKMLGAPVFTIDVRIREIAAAI